MLIWDMFACLFVMVWGVLYRQKLIYYDLLICFLFCMFDYNFNFCINFVFVFQILFSHFGICFVDRQNTF